MGDVYVKGDVHGNILAAFSYRRNPELRQLTEDDVVVVCGDVGLGWGGADKTYRYLLDFLAAKPWTTLLLRGNHDNTDVIRDHSKPSLGNGKNISLACGTLCNPVCGDKIYDSVFWVPDAAVLDVCGERCLCVGGASSHDIWHLVYPSEKDRKRRYRKSGMFYREVGKTWWPDEEVNVHYLWSLLNEHGVQEWMLGAVDDSWYGDFDFVFTHDCPAVMCGEYARPGSPRLKPTRGESAFEILRTHLGYKFWVHGHMHTFLRYGMRQNEDDGRKSCCVCIYKDLFKLPHGSDEFQDWEHVCQCAQMV